MALIQEVKTVAKWLIDFGKQVDTSFSDGWQWKDLVSFMDDFFAAPGMATALPAAWAAVKPGLSPEDREEFVQYVKVTLVLDSHAEAEAKAEGIVEWIVATDKFVRLFKKKKP